MPRTIIIVKKWKLHKEENCYVLSNSEEEVLRTQYAPIEFPDYYVLDGPGNVGFRLFKGQGEYECRNTQ